MHYVLRAELAPAIPASPDLMTSYAMSSVAIGSNLLLEELGASQRAKLSVPAYDAAAEKVFGVPEFAANLRAAFSQRDDAWYIFTDFAEFTRNAERVTVNKTAYSITSLRSGSEIAVSQLSQTVHSAIDGKGKLLSPGMPQETAKTGRTILMSVSQAIQTIRAHRDELEPYWRVK